MASPLIRVFRIRRRIAWTGYSLLALCYGWTACVGLSELPRQFRWFYALMSVALVYSCFSRPGLFSFFDLVGLMSMPRFRGAAPTTSSATSALPLIRTPVSPGCSPVKKAKIGLVLAGGGGKAAYQVGCWKALQARGVKIDAVSGTSAGALNIALIAAGDPVLAEEVWGNLSASQLVKVSVGGLPFLPLIFKRYRRQYVGDSNGRLLASLLSIIFGLGLGWLLYIYWRAALAFGTSTIDAKIIIALAGLATTFLILSVAQNFRGMFTHRVNPSYFQADRMKNLLRQLVPPGLFSRSPLTCYITLAKEAHIYDDREPPHLRRKRKWIVFRSKTGRPTPRIVYIPIYLALGDIELKHGISSVHEMLMLSGALPALFPGQWAGDSAILDGGVADNLPLSPLLELGCSRIFVIYLNPRGTDKVDGRIFETITEGGVLAKIGWHARLAVLSKRFGNVRSLVEAGDWYALPWALEGDPLLKFADNPQLCSELVHIVPSQDLGSFLTGTLNFTGAKARWLIDLGYKDMCAALDQLL
jgi:predicted acylesterase/phospholipase RssA